MKICSMIHKRKCENTDITTIRVSSESHLHWKNLFHKNPLYFTFYADFEADIEIDNSSTSNKTTNFYEQMPVINGYHVKSDMEDVLKSSYYKSRLCYCSVDWFVKEANTLEKKWLSILKTLRRISIR